MKRRNFLKLAGISSLGAAGVLRSSGSPSVRAADEHAMAPFAQAEDAETMDRLHGEGVQIFLDNIGKDTTFWRPQMEFTMDGDVKVYEIKVQQLDWETKPGTVYPAMAYNGMIPGPEIRVTEGDKLRFLVTNEMDQSTGVHWHGLLVPNSMDGVPFVTQPPIKPGETFTYEFTARNSGSHMYHSHHNAAEQVSSG
ncbi:MAG: multicopper oxidase domain-containing protein, partial [Anaerolineae bacterium]|nr:multicopper oxidase domain-containing protein [Anaerolineae bacterium]